MNLLYTIMNTKTNITHKFKTKNQEIVDELCSLKPVKPGTRQGYLTTLNNYTSYQNMSFQELLKEAEQEELNGTPLKHRKIRQRLTGYMNFLREHNYNNLTINSYLKRIRYIYKMYYIELPILFYPKTKQKDSIYDIVTVEDIKKVLKNTNNIKYQATILFMLSSGQAAAEMISLTIQDFINATSEYHNETNIINVISVLERKKFIIPLFDMFRTKEDVSYYTVCSHEAVEYILSYLKQRIYQKGIPDPTDKLFDLKYPAFSDFLRRQNDVLGMGKVNNTHRFFTSHALRKFFANTLFAANIESMKIDFMMGHTLPPVQAAYFKANPKIIKEEYKHVVNHVTIFSDLTYQNIKSTEKQELEQLRREQKEDRLKMKRIEQTINRLILENK